MPGVNQMILLAIIFYIMNLEIIQNEDIHVIKEGLKYSYPLGNGYFKEQVEFALG